MPPWPYNVGVSLARSPVVLRRIVRLSLLMIHLVWGIVLTGGVFPMIGPARRDRIITRWSRRLLHILGVRLRVGAIAEVNGGALLVCNHVSWLDVYLINATQRVHFVSKAEVRAWPIVGWLAHKTGTLFIERGRRADTARINAEMRDLMQHGAWVAVFPEGTTSDGHSLRRFMPSLLQPAVELNCLIVPAALRYRTLTGEYSAAPAYIDQIGLWQSLLQIVSEPGLIAELHFGEPILPNGHRRDLAAQAETATAKLLGVAPAGTVPKTPADPPA
ncbi:MAG: 1-acyl-sn-glycerol-3-phosphate acyltransferase [Sulfuriferula multivorans]|uniref:1-acyl-sn-glycerol-3-phosphate acyltransferase n=1 Tax=Sulfuriferula multivorans TaxID=1559896 RepID=A0A7C9TA01_9PROT|nr:1-acyl-sn-glycerol-3-phosphate acyltransferase [Sulfuriferula multivorans]